MLRKLLGHERQVETVRRIQLPLFKVGFCLDGHLFHVVTHLIDFRNALIVDLLQGAHPLFESVTILLGGIYHHLHGLVCRYFNYFLFLSLLHLL